jgi:hypothetical protein
MYASGWEREREMLNRLKAVEIKGKKVRKKERFVKKKSHPKNHGFASKRPRKFKKLKVS